MDEWSDVIGEEKKYIMDRVRNRCLNADLKHEQMLAQNVSLKYGDLISC